MPFNRTVFAKLQEELKRPEICYLFGARQVGKTYLLESVLEAIKSKSKKPNFKYYNLEIPSDLAQFSGSDAEIFDLLKESPKYLFIDEFHYLENASHIFKAIYDSDLDIKIFASGSSALEMHKHLAESLAGRTRKYQLAPLSIEEYVSDSRTNDKLSAKDFDRIAQFGTLPGTYYDKKLRYRNTEERKEYLMQILETYIQRDIKSHLREENLSAFNSLLFLLAEYQGQIVSTSSLANDLKVSRPTVEKYIELLEQTYVLHTLTPFSGNLANELKKSKKYYLYDWGERNALLKDFSELDKREDKGCFWESLIYAHLRSLKTVEVDIHFWRTSSGNEVDFVWRKNRKLTAIEVKSNLKKPEIASGLKSFLRAYPKTEKAIVFNESVSSIEDYRGHQIHFVRFRDLLEIEGLIQ